MTTDKEYSDSIKRTIRSLKKSEIRIRLSSAADILKAELIWDNFFDLKNPESKTAKYTLADLEAMDKEEYKKVIGEFYWNVYYRLFKDNYYYDTPYEIQSLSQLGLSPLADLEEIKSRFRQLAKKYHPDAGGSKEEFIELYKIYSDLKNKY